MDVRVQSYRTNYPELDKNVEVDDGKITEKKFLKINKIPSRAGSLSLKRTLIQKHSPSRKMLQNSKSKLGANYGKKSKLGRTDFQKKLDIEGRSRNEVLPLSEKLTGVNQSLVKSLLEKHPLLETASYINCETSCRETCDSLLK